MRAPRVPCALLMLPLAACVGEIVSVPGQPPSIVDGGVGRDDAGRPPPPGTDGGMPIPMDGGPGGGRDMCGDTRPLAVYYGTPEPTYLPMTAGQIYAVGSFNGCSGLLIAPTWVLSANHCGHSRGTEFCIGVEADRPNHCFPARAVYDEPSGGDMTILQIDDATAELPEVIPVPILTEDMGSSWVGRTAEAAGYGQQEDGGFNEREFTAEPIVDVSGDTLTIDGEGRHGVCFGDSGGPVMVIASDGTVRVAGALSNGDGSCVGRDNYTRVDVYRDWIESHTGPTAPPGGGGCGAVTEEGRCMSGTAVFCEDDTLRSERCSGSCGWDGAAGGFRCITGSDPCMGVDSLGACMGQIARWCDGGVLRTRDCAACGQSCGMSADVGGIYCLDSPPDACADGVGMIGRCNGDIVEWCQDGTSMSRDCTDRGERCRWISDSVGYDCG